MFPGPIFGKELQTAARGPRTYLVRSLTGAAIAVHVAMNVEIPGGWRNAGALTPGEVAALANSAFLWFASTQAVVVVALVPLLVAGAVAGERAAGTLGLLLASGLTAAEVLADKLAARLLLTVVLMAVGLPILALIGLYGGVDPAEALMYYGGTLATAWLTAALALLVSVHAPRWPGPSSVPTRPASPGSYCPSGSPSGLALAARRPCLRGSGPLSHGRARFRSLVPVGFGGHPQAPHRR